MSTVICKSAKEVTKSSESVIAQSESNDCFVYALATAFDLPYDEAHQVVKDTFNRQEGRGTKRRMIDLQTPNLNINGKVIEEVMNKPTTQYKVYGEIKNRALRVGSFAKKFSSGTYLLYTRNHALTVKDGVVIDNRTEKSVKALVEKAFKVGEGI